MRLDVGASRVNTLRCRGRGWWNRLEKRERATAKEKY
jgi:hypothetical protein